MESQNVNDNNQLIITVSKKDIEILGIKIISDKIENYMFDSKLGIIPLDGYVLVGRHEKLVLMDINNEGCIIGAIQSTKDSKSVGVLFEPIPEKMEQKSKKSNTHK